MKKRKLNIILTTMMVIVVVISFTGCGFLGNAIIGAYITNDISSRLNEPDYNDMDPEDVAAAEKDEKNILMPPQMPQKGNDLIAFGDESYKSKNYKEALEAFNKALLEGDDYKTYNKIGNCYYYLGEKENAIKAYEKSLKLNPENKKLKEWLNNYK